MFFQAELSQNIAVAVTQTKEALIGERFVSLENLDESVLGKFWNGSNFIPVVKPNSIQESEELDEAALIELCQLYGGMTDNMLVEVYENSLLKAFIIKLKASKRIRPDDPRTIAGLSALEALNYLPNGKESVLDNWPKI